jgi:RND superfamily putative drug exporter
VQEVCNVFSRLGLLVTRRPWWVIAVWVIAAAVIVMVAPSLSSVSSSDQTHFLPNSYESMKAQHLAERAFPQNAGATGVFVVQRADGARLTASDLNRIAALTTGLNMARIGQVAAVLTNRTMLAPNGTTQLVTVVFNGRPGDSKLQSAVPVLRDKAATLLRGSGLRAGLAGMVAMQYDTMKSFKSAEKIVAVVTIAMIVVLLGLIFRSPIAGALPIASIGLVYGLSTSVLALLAKGIGFTVDASITSLLIVVLFGIGTDYILFLLFRYRERLRAGDESSTAVMTSVHRVGQAITSSGLVVMAAMAALLLSRLKSFQTMAPAFVIAVTLMLLASLTLIPALLTLLGPKVFWPSKRWQAVPQSRLWQRMAGQIARHPGRMAFVSGGLLAALASGALFMHSSYDVSGQLPSNTKSALAAKQLQSAFPAGALSPTQVYVTGAQPLSSTELAMVSARLKGVTGVAAVTPALLTKNGRTASISVSLKAPPFSAQALNVAQSIRNVAHAAAPTGQRVLVGGQSMAFADVRSASARDYRVIFPVAALLIVLILAVLLRSAVAPVYLLVGVGLGFAATLGASVIAFQGIQGDPGIVFMMPMIVYLFVVAVGTDYNILLTTRLREEVVEGASPHDAAAMAVAHAGPTVAAAGVILAGTFASLMVTGVKLLSEMGFAVAFGILLVAIVMASTLVPSIATLLGRHIWWPGHQGSRPQAALAGLSEHVREHPEDTHTSWPVDEPSVPAPDAVVD